MHTYMHERAHTHTEKIAVFVCARLCMCVYVCVYSSLHRMQSPRAVVPAVCIVYCALPQRVGTRGDGRALRTRSNLLIIYSDWIGQHN